jgi:hypothetical protein
MLSCHARLATIPALDEVAVCRAATCYAVAIARLDIDINSNKQHALKPQMSKQHNELYVASANSHTDKSRLGNRLHPPFQCTCFQIGSGHKPTQPMSTLGLMPCDPKSGLDVPDAMPYDPLPMQTWCSCGSGPILAESILNCTRPCWIRLRAHTWLRQAGCEVQRSGSESYAVCSGSDLIWAEPILSCTRPYSIRLRIRTWPGRAGCDVLRSGSDLYAGCLGSDTTLVELLLSCIRSYSIRLRTRTWPGRAGCDVIRSGSEPYTGCSGSELFLAESSLTCIKPCAIRPRTRAWS